MTAQTPTGVRELLARHGLEPRKRLGQHFLADPNIVRRIVAAAGVAPGGRVVEIGAGTGALTVALAATGAQVVAYEVDERLAPLLGDVVAGTSVDLRFADATKVDFDADLPPGEWTLVANLPYNVGTPIVLDLLRDVPRVTRMVVMVQHEVAERLAARAGTKEYGVPSVVAQIHAEVSVLFRVPPQVFVPPPNVGSAVVELRRSAAPREAAGAVRLAGLAFAQRRKMLRSSLSAVTSGRPSLLEEAGVSPTDRAGDLAPADYLRLAGVLDA